VVEDAVLVRRDELDEHVSIGCGDDPLPVDELDGSAESRRPLGQPGRVTGEPVDVGDRAIDVHAEVYGRPSHAGQRR